MAKIYWLHGQPGSGKTTHGKRLQMWLQTDKVNWRKSVFHIDESEIKKLYKETDTIETILAISRYLLATNHDVVVSAVTPSKEFREDLKKDLKVTEVYCHTRNKIGKEIIVEYERPDTNYIDLDTTGEIENNFEKLIKMLL